MKHGQAWLVAGAALALCGCAFAAAKQVVTRTNVGTRPGGVGYGTPLKPAPGDELACFSAGCFWGVENTFRHVPGVVATAVGYTGGHTNNPTYPQVCTHTTGHAESVLIEFDPKKVTYADLLKVFWSSHDPTTLNRQGPDFGSNYRSAIWCFTPDQVQEARQSLNRAQWNFANKIVTEINPAQPFYLAEEYHQQYDEKNGTLSCPMGG